MTYLEIRSTIRKRYEIELRANRLLHLRKIAELVDCPLA